MAPACQFQQEPKSSENGLKLQNQEAIRLLDQWMSENDDRDDQWWQEFERHLQNHRFSIRNAETK